MTASEPPSVTDVVAVAESLGMRLEPEEAELYQRLLSHQLEKVGSFLASDTLDEASPPAAHGKRNPGRPPTRDEDPLNAWLWRCQIEGASDGLLAGRTVSFKDNIPVAGLPLTYGSRLMEGFVPDFDATIVARVLEQGGTIIGKNNMDGFSDVVGDYGPTRNPHNPDHIVGASSSGSAAAVAASEVDISFGVDQGGSIRVPAAWAGAIGLKPTFGLISCFGISNGDEQSIDFTGPITRTVEDAAAALDAVAGVDGLDPRQGREVPERLDATSVLGRDLSGLRIGVLEEGFDGVESRVHDQVMTAIDVLANAGAEVSRVSAPQHRLASEAASTLAIEGMLAIFRSGIFGSFSKTYYPASLIAAINAMWDTQTDLLAQHLKLRYLLGMFSRARYQGRAYAKAQNLRPRFVEIYDSILASVDVLVMPTCPTTAPEAGPSLSETYFASLQQDVTRVSNTQPFNYTGHPALAVPCGKANGLPTSMQLVGRFFDDPLVLQVAFAYQHSVDWDEIIQVDSHAE